MGRRLSSLEVAVADRQALAVVGDALADAVEQFAHEAQHRAMAGEFEACVAEECVAARAWRHARERLK